MPLGAQLLLVFVAGGGHRQLPQRLHLPAAAGEKPALARLALRPLFAADPLVRQSPLVSYWLLRGRCRVCGKPFSVRYFLVELLTALSFVGLYYLEVVRERPSTWTAALPRPEARIDPGLARHLRLSRRAVRFLLVAVVCDLDHRSIPLPLTIDRHVVGLIGSVLWPWPWPYFAGRGYRRHAGPGPAVVAAVARRVSRHDRPLCLAGLGSSARLAQPGGNWQTGLATGLAGLWWAR